MAQPKENYNGPHRPFKEIDARIDNQFFDDDPKLCEN
jgi:hypothetical protein